MAGMPGMGGVGTPQMEKRSMLQYMADGIRAKVPQSKVTVTDNGIQVIFTKEIILNEVFKNAKELAQVAEVEVDTRGIVVTIRV